MCIQTVTKIILILLHSGQHPFQFYFKYMNPHFTMLCHQMLSLAMGSNFHSLSPPATTTSHFVHSSLVYQLYAKEVHFYCFVTKSNSQIQHAPNIHSHVFNSFDRTIIHGESHQIFTSSFPSNGISLHFTIEPLPPFAKLCFLHQNSQNH